MTLDEFITRARAVHGDKYGYGTVVFVNTITPVLIYCKKCGRYFMQRPKKHMTGQGCPHCNGGARKMKEDFIAKARSIHGDLYTYDGFVYHNNKTKGTIHCNTCGRDFMMTPDNHTSKNAQGCPYCKMSHLEREVMVLLEKMGEDFVYQANKEELPWLKTSRGSFSLDFYLPQYNLAIECQGEQHYRARQRGIFTEERVEKIKRRDSEKLRRCVENDIAVRYVRYDDQEIERTVRDILNEGIIIHKMNEHGIMD